MIHLDLKPDNIFLTYPDDESVAPASSLAPDGAARCGRPSSYGHATACPGHVPTDSDAPGSAPANLVVKIVDFGIPKLRESVMHTLTGTVLGTPACFKAYARVIGKPMPTPPSFNSG